MLSLCLLYLFDINYPYLEYYGNLEFSTHEVLGLPFHFNLDEISIPLYVLVSFLMFCHIIFNTGEQYEKGDMILLFLINVFIFSMLFGFSIDFK